MLSTCACRGRGGRRWSSAAARRSRGRWRERRGRCRPDPLAGAVGKRPGLGAVTLGGKRYVEAGDMGQTKPWVFDGVQVPAWAGARLAALPEALRLATYGRVERVGPHDFGPGTGV